MRAFSCLCSPTPENFFSHQERNFPSPKPYPVTLPSYLPPSAPQKQYPHSQEGLGVPASEHPSLAASAPQLSRAQAPSWAMEGIGMQTADRSE